jgi:tyrosyl-tRNA synthetase
MKFTIFPENSNIDKIGVVKFGIDCTSPQGLHLGHILPLKILKFLRDKGNDIHIILGTFTSEVSDPTGRDATRPTLSKEQIEESAEVILRQIKRILGDNITIHRNNEWFDKMTLPEVMKTLSNFTIQKLLNRESFQKRIENNSTISVPEMLYPILQGIDSVKLNATYEIGATEQLLNLISGRELQEIHGQEPQICIMSPVLTGIDGSGRKMSKSFNNTINLNDTPEDVFGKAMSISDETMREWLPIFFDEIDIKKHPMVQKKDLAFQITKEIWGEEAAELGKNHFESVIQSKQIPEDMPEFPVGNLIEIVSKVINGSKSEARRLFQSNAVKINGEKVVEAFQVKSGDIIKVGKRHFVKII